MQNAYDTYDDLNSDWNFNKLPNLLTSILDTKKRDGTRLPIYGVTSSYTYFGEYGSHAGMHCEDLRFKSANYLYTNSAVKLKSKSTSTFNSSSRRGQKLTTPDEYESNNDSYTSVMDSLNQMIEQNVNIQRQDAVVVPRLEFLNESEIIFSDDNNLLITEGKCTESSIDATDPAFVDVAEDPSLLPLATAIITTTSTSKLTEFLNGILESNEHSTVFEEEPSTPRRQPSPTVFEEEPST
uniref:Uncharacterized protein n=1 Tax=Panagrolaimus sp. ES5 TaxID=591445 RepID=A0AC34FQZ1_9BILA